MTNPQNLKPLKKGYDPRRNLKGVPKDAIAARKAIREIGAELVKIKDGSEEVDVTRFYVMIRAMFQSRAPADRAAILKALAPGLLTDTVEHTGAGGGPLEGTKVYVTVSPDDWDKIKKDNAAKN